MTPLLRIAAPMSDDVSARWTTPEERAAAARFGCARRRAEFLTWRALVRQELGADVGIGYDAVGAPVLVGSPLFLSVSHCPGRVAVALSDARCGVDIEPAERDFGRVAARCMTAQERALSDDPLWPGIVWCAKEALYKYAGRPGLDLLRDLRIERFDPAARCLTGRIAGGPPEELEVRCEEGFIVVAIFE